MFNDYEMWRDIYVKQRMTSRPFNVHAKKWRHNKSRSFTVRDWFNMASCSGDQKRTLTERFELRAAIKFSANSGMTSTETWKFFSDNDIGKMCSRKIVFDWHKRFREGRVDISDFRSGRPRISDSAKNVQDAISDDKRRGTRFQNRELKFAVRRAVARVGEDFKDVYSEWLERHIKCVACGGSYFEKEWKTWGKRNSN